MLFSTQFFWTNSFLTVLGFSLYYAVARMASSATAIQASHHAVARVKVTFVQCLSSSNATQLCSDETMCDLPTLQ